MKNVKLIAISTALVSLLSVSCSHHHKKPGHRHHAPPMPTDGQISKVLTTANDGEIALAKYVVANGKSKDVKDFAKGMIKDHSMNNMKTKELETKINVEPMPSPNADALVRDGEMSKTMLMKLKGKDLDKAYIDDQVTTHQNVLSDLKSNLIPAAKDSELKAHLEMTATKVEEHLEHAKMIQSKMM